MGTEERTFWKDEFKSTTDLSSGRLFLTTGKDRKVDNDSWQLNGGTTMLLVPAELAHLKDQWQERRVQGTPDLRICYVMGAPQIAD